MKLRMEALQVNDNVLVMTGSSQNNEKFKDDMAEVLSNLTDFNVMNFFTEIITPLSILNKFMEDCQKHPGPEAVANFKHVYHENSLLTLSFTLTSLFEHKSTNPINLEAMDEALYKKWTDIIKKISQQILTLEAFADGILGTRSQFKYNQLIDESMKILEVMENLKKEWENYIWLQMKDFLKDFIPNNRDLNNNQKAMKIVTKLDAYNSKEAFYIVVCDTPSNADYVLLKNFVDEDQFIIVKDNTTSLYVYRSFYGMSASFDDVEKLKTGTEWYQQYPHRGDPGMPSGLMNHQLANSGFNMLIGSVNEEIYWVNCPQFECGPGWTTKKCDYGASIDQIYIVGFR